jgi:hypothetical protein
VDKGKKIAAPDGKIITKKWIHCGTYAERAGYNLNKTSVLSNMNFVQWNGFKVRVQHRPR